MSRFEPTEVGWRIGTSKVPVGVALWQPWDRTAGVIGPQGSGKTLDILTPALLQAPGAALVTSPNQTTCSSPSPPAKREALWRCSTRSVPRQGCRS